MGFPSFPMETSFRVIYLSILKLIFNEQRVAGQNQNSKLKTESSPGDIK